MNRAARRLRMMNDLDHFVQTLSRRVLYLGGRKARRATFRLMGKNPPPIRYSNQFKKFLPKLWHQHDIVSTDSTIV